MIDMLVLLISDLTAIVSTNAGMPGPDAQP
jgi:hypothetical protein